MVQFVKRYWEQTESQVDLASSETGWNTKSQFWHTGFRPKRTIRVVFFTAEEQGYLGAEHYYESHANDSHERVIFACESDSGAFRPLNWRSKFSTAASPNQTKILDQILFLINKFDVPLFLENAGWFGQNFLKRDQWYAYVCISRARNLQLLS